jgi:hypothetical protein
MRDDDDFQLRNYQDDLDTGFDATDPLMEEEMDDPTEELHVPPDELREELAKLDAEDEEYDVDIPKISENSKQDIGY